MQLEGNLPGNVFVLSVVNEIIVFGKGVFMKVFTLARVSVVCGLALGVMAVWSSAAPGMVDAITLRGAGCTAFENCVEAGSCEGTYAGCTSGSLQKCHTGAPPSRR